MEIFQRTASAGFAICVAARFYDVEDGQVRVGGQDVKQLEMASLRQAMACVPQDMVLFNDTIYYNIAYGNLSAPQEQVEAAAKAAQVGRLTFLGGIPPALRFSTTPLLCSCCVHAGITKVCLLYRPWHFCQPAPFPVSSNRLCIGLPAGMVIITTADLSMKYYHM